MYKRSAKLAVRPRFSKIQSLVFVVSFGLIGILIWKSLAAPNPNLSGDLNNDNKVDITDLSILLSDYGTNNPAADINGDGTVSVLDLSSLLSHFGQTYSGSTNPLSVSVSGNNLVDSNGNTVQLRGINRSGTQYACVDGYGFFDGPTDDTSLGYIKAWGVNAVRVSLNEDCWLGINGAPAAYSGSNYQNAIVSYVSRLNNQGFRVILDLHFAAPGTTLTTSSLDQLPMADRDHSPAFWQGVANTFKSNPSVLFDLFNEPYPDSNRNTTAAWTCVRDGGTCPGVNYTAAGSQEMLNAIRGTGATNVVMVGGPQYAGVVDKWSTYAPADPLHQLAASIHIYYNTPADPEWAPCYLQSCWENTMAPLAQTVPIVIGEVGEHDCSTGLINGTALSPTQPSLLDWSDQHNISYLAWSWISNGGGNCASEPSLISNYNGSPTNYGAGIKAHLLSR